MYGSHQHHNDLCYLDPSDRLSGPLVSHHVYKLIRAMDYLLVTFSWAARAERGWAFGSQRSGPDPRCPPERTWPPSCPTPLRSYSSPAGTDGAKLQLESCDHIWESEATVGWRTAARLPGSRLLLSYFNGYRVSSSSWTPRLLSSSI